MNVLQLDKNILSEAKEFFEFDTWKELYIFLTEQYYPVKVLKRYLENKKEIQKLFTFIDYPEWINKQKFQRDRKRKLFDIVGRPSSSYSQKTLLYNFADKIFKIDFSPYYANIEIDNYIKSLY